MKTILITGTTSGIGRVTALRLAEQGHHIVMANRNQEKSEQLAKEITDQTGNSNISVLELDLSSLQSIRACAVQFKAEFDSLDVLINNAGLMAHEQIITEDGFEMQFAVNNLAPFLLTMELLPVLEAGAPSHVIFVTSMMHKFGKLDFESFQGWNKYSGSGAYNQSKLAIMLIARELAERLKGKNIAVNTLHPGAVSTGILDGYSKIIQPLLRLFFTSPEKGARTSLYLAGLEADDRPTGRYFSSAREAKANPLVEDAQLRSKLWNLCCDYCAIPNEL
jgi:NAD(P)-dependent dehydrogenase (short-subunit alcohol dehydrogenase family)